MFPPRWHAFFLALIPAACAQQTENTSTVQDIQSVCAPTQTQSDQAFHITVSGGCVSQGDAYTCTASAASHRVDVKLIGPNKCADCNCVPVVKPCGIPALGTGSWQMLFLQGSQFDRALEVDPSFPVFSCPKPDGGTAHDASL